MCPKLNNELKSLLIITLGFMIQDSAVNTLKSMQKTIVSSIADDKPGFTVGGYTLKGIQNTVTCISLWCAPYLCQTIGARQTIILTSLGYVYYIGSYAIEEEWGVYSAAVSLGLAYAIVVPPRSQYLIEGSKPENVARNVGICYSLQKIVQILCNIFVFYTFEGKKYVNQSTRRVTIFGLLGIAALPTVFFFFLPKTTKDCAKETHSFVTTVKKAWHILITPTMLFMCITLTYFGLEHSFEEGVYSPSVGFTLAFGNSAKELVPLSSISRSIGALLGYLYSILLGARLKSRSFAGRLMVSSGALGQLIAYIIIFLSLPDHASIGSTEDKSFFEPSVFLALLCALLLGFGDACLEAQVYSFVGAYFREQSGEASGLCSFVKNIFVSLSYYWCDYVGLHTQVVYLSAAAVVGAVGYLYTEHLSESLQNKEIAEKSSQQAPNT